MALKQDGVDFVPCPKQGTKIEDVVLNRVCILGIFCPKQDQGFKPSSAHQFPEIGRVLPPRDITQQTRFIRMFSAILFYYKLYYTLSSLNKQFGLQGNLEMYMKKHFVHNIIIFFKKIQQ